MMRKPPQDFLWTPKSLVVLSFLFFGCHATKNSTSSVEDVLFETGFETGVLDWDNTWSLEGTGRAWIEDGSLLMQEDSAGVGLVLWLQKDWPSEVSLAFDVTFNNNRGIGVFFLAAREVDGRDALDPVTPRTGEYDEYIRGTLANHSFSMHRFWPDGRNNPGANLRKNPGFNLLSQALPDPVMESGRTYRIEAEKGRSGIVIRVNGNVVHDWTDDGSYGASLGEGKIGFRLRGDPSCIMKIDNLVIW